MSDELNPQQAGSRLILPPISRTALGMDDGGPHYAYIDISYWVVRMTMESLLRHEGFRVYGPFDLPDAPSDRDLRFNLLMSDDLALISCLRLVDNARPFTLFIAVVPDDKELVLKATKAGAHHVVPIPREMWPEH